jgi:hypothetical protein
MKMHRGLFLLASAAIAVALTGSRAQAAYTYSTNIVINSVTVGGTTTNTPGAGAQFVSAGGTTVNFQDILTPGTFLTPGTLSANIANIGVGTLSSAPETFNINYTDTITITNPAVGGATGTFSVTGVLQLVGVQNSGGATGGTVNNQYLPPFIQGPTTITSPAVFTVLFGNGVLNDLFGPPTILPVSNPTTNGGSLGAVINSSVPEPTSMALIGIGLTGLLGYSWRRREVARRLLVD